MIDNKDFYPTPEALIRKMKYKLDWKRVSNILEPSAGEGHIADYIRETEKYHKMKVSCIESDPRCQNVLKGKGHRLIDSDFLNYRGLDRFDTIIMNPPFSNGASHLLRAIDLMYNGQIVCLLNAETIRNPFSNERKFLARRLDELGAEIEFISDGFVDAERRTSVETALIYINIENDIDDLIFEGCEDKREHVVELEKKMEVIPRNSVEFNVALYEKDIEKGLDLIKSYYQYGGKFLHLNVIESSYENNLEMKKPELNEMVNQFVARVRRHHWKKILELPNVKKRMTAKVKEKFLAEINRQTEMDFTFSNVQQFIINLIGNYENILNEAVGEVFDLMTSKHSWYPETKNNIYLFDGWKTNDCFKVNQKVILPVSYGKEVFWDEFQDKWKFSEWRMNFSLTDIDRVMNYFDDASEYVSIVDAIEAGFAEGNSRNLMSTYFKINVYKKGTIHLTFRSDEILRRFNIVGCQNKNFLPPKYGTKSYSDLSENEKRVVRNFENVEVYDKNVLKVGYSMKEDVKMIGMK